MPHQRETLGIAEIVTQPREDQWIRVGSGMVAPSRFAAYLQLAPPDLQVALEVFVGNGGAPVVEQIIVRPGARTPITSTTLRLVLVDPLVRAALRNVSRPAIERPDMAPGAFQVPGEGAENRAWVSVAPGAGDRVLQAARIYNEALATGSRAPAEAVAKAVSISRPQAARYIRRARAAGLIPPVDQVVRRRSVLPDGGHQEPFPLSRSAPPGERER